MEQLIVEGGTAIAIFIRCFADKKGIEEELRRRLYIDFPRGALATISVKFSLPSIANRPEYKNILNSFVETINLLQVLLVLMTAYGSAALGQLFFFHVVLIRKVNHMVAPQISSITYHACFSGYFQLLKV